MSTSTAPRAESIIRSAARPSPMRSAVWLVSVTLLAFSALAVAPPAGATDCVAPPRSLTINGGTSRNRTTINASADGGTAISNARGGDGNLAIGILGDAAAGNGGTARSSANGGAIDLDDINSGNNTGNVIRVRSASKPTACVGGGTTIAKRAVPSTSSRVVINGGTSTNSTTINASADGGTAISNARGGDNNVAIGILGGASAGNGGTASANANGGAIAIGDINSGGNTGNVIRIRNLSGNAQISGGTSSNATTINVSADGGTAIADASGGDGNVAVGLGVLGTLTTGASAGNGGTAESSANGGAISIGDINSGGNTGNVIQAENLSGNASIDGGTSSNTTTVNVSADGGTAIANASGGDGNVAVDLAVVEDPAVAAARQAELDRLAAEQAELERLQQEAAALEVVDEFANIEQESPESPPNCSNFSCEADAGNGGTAETQASGGAISVGEVDSGGNTGNVIEYSE